GPHTILEAFNTTGSTSLDKTGSTLTRADVDLTETHQASANAPTFVWSGGTLTATQQAALAAASRLTLIESDSTGAGAASIGVSYSAAHSAFDFLGTGQTLTITYNVTVSDGTASSTKPVTITVAGSNNAPVLAPYVSGPHTILEAFNTTGSTSLDSASGTLTFTDVDLTDTHQASASAPTFVWSGGTLTAAQQAALTAASTLTLSESDSTGSGTGSVGFTFSAADKTFDFLGTGQTLTITYNVTVSDGTASSTKPVTITVAGSNDAPVLAADASGPHGIITGSTSLDSTSGTLTFTDVDLTDTHQASASAPTFVWSGGTLTAAQQAALTAASTLTLSESDSTGSGTGSVGFTFSAADKTFDFLGTGQTLTITYNVTVSDGTASSTKPVTITVAGSNDAPVLAADASGPHGIITGSTSLDSTSGTLTFTDVDLTDTHQASASAPTFVWSGGTLTAAQQAALTAASTLTLSESDSTGSGTGSVGFTFSAADKTFDFLGTGQTLTITYNVTVSDGTASSTKPVTITVAGSNDAPVLAADASGPHGIITGSTSLDSTSGTLTFTDVDLTDTHQASASAPTFVWSGGTLTAAQQAALTAASTLTLSESDSTGSGSGSVGFTFSAADSAFDFLAAGQTLTVTYNVTVTDNNGVSSTQPVTITVTGTNDAPVLAPDVSGPHTILEAFNTTGSTSLDSTSGTLTFTDVDLTDTHQASASAPTFVWSGGTLTAAQQAALTAASTLTLSESDSTGSGAGSI